MTQRPTDHDASDLSSHPPQTPGSDELNDTVDDFLAVISPRPRASDSAQERVYTKALAEFDALPVSQAYSWPMALAASIVGALALSFMAWQLTEQPLPSPTIASISYATGEFSVSGNRAELALDSKRDATPLSAGSKIVTSEHGRMMLTLGTDTSVRIDVGSQIALRDAGEISLEQGRIYVDSRGDDSALTVLSSGVRVTKVGTQFSVERRGEELLLAVREGKVRLGTEGGPVLLTSDSGVAQQVRLRGGRVMQRSELSFDEPEAWAWIQQARPDFATADASLYEYLAWVARETGRTLAFEVGAESVAKRERELVWGARRVGVDDMELFLRAAAEPLASIPDADPSLLRVALLRDSRRMNR